MFSNNAHLYCITSKLFPLIKVNSNSLFRIDFQSRQKGPPQCSTMNSLINLKSELLLAEVQGA